MVCNCNTHSISLPAHEEFDFKQCLVYLNRSDNECLHSIEGDVLYKAVRLNGEKTVLKVDSADQKIRIEFPYNAPTEALITETVGYIRDLFDLDRDLSPFYHLAVTDVILKNLVEKYRGLRIVGIPDLFEALSWAVTGQQINLTFAYTLKRRFVEAFGEKCSCSVDDIWLYPEPGTIADLQLSDLTALQFTKQKASYVIGIAKSFSDGTLDKKDLMHKSYDEVFAKLTPIRGVGPWTADYAIMKCFKIPSAFPIGDVGLHNALKNILGLAEKPRIDVIKSLAAGWKGWEAYAVFYLWRSLQD